MKHKKYNVKRQNKVIGVYPEVEFLMIKNNIFPQLIHTSNLIKKCKAKKSLDNTSAAYNILKNLIPNYVNYLKQQFNLHGYDDETIEKRIYLLDEYYTTFEKLKVEGIFDSRSKIRSTILEEFMFILFKDMIEELTLKCGNNGHLVKCGTANAYTNLYFTAKNVIDFIINPKVSINEKNQDYAIYREIPIIIPKEDNNYNNPIAKIIANVPIIAIENKTFLDKTMLEGSVATAEKLKSGNPYSTYIVVTETYAVDDDVDPVYSRIDQIFVLRKCKTNKDNRIENPISKDVVKKLVTLVSSKLNRQWSNVYTKLHDEGTII